MKVKTIEELEKEVGHLKAEIQSLKKKQKEIDKTLQETEVRMHNALDEIDNLAISIDANDSITFCNDFFLKFTGWDEKDVIGKNWKDILTTPEDKVRNDNELEQLISKGSLIKSVKRKIQIADGSFRVIRFHIIYQNTSDGRIAGTTLTGEDITEKKQRIKKLKEGDEQLKDLFENANDLIQVFSLDGQINMVNKAWKEILKYDEEEWSNINFNTILHPDHRAETKEHLNNILLGKKDDKFETVLRSKSGKDIYVIASVNVKYEKNKAVAFRGIFHDNTERVRAESAQNLYNKITTLAINSANLESLLHNIHEELRKLISVNNFHVALLDKEHHILTFPYYVDEHQGGKNIIFSRPISKGLTEYSLFRSEPTFLYEEDITNLSQEGIIEPLGVHPKIWLGVPLKLENRTIGVIAVKSHSDRNKYNKRHLDLLDFISGQIALVIERKRNEEMIAEQRARLNSIFESSSHLIWSVNRKMRLTSFNHNYSEAVFLKYKTFPQLYYAGEEDASSQLLYLSDIDFHDYVEDKYKAAFTGFPQHYETRFTDPNSGEVKWRETYLNPIFLPDGRIEEVSGISHDVTEKKNYELFIQDSEEKFRTIFESFPDIYYRTDLYGKISLMSPSGFEITGFTEDEIQEKNIVDFYVSTDSNTNIIRRLLLHGTIKNYESKLRLKDGSMIHCISSLRFIYDKNNKPVAIEGVARDITFLKKTTEEYMKAKDIAEKSLKVKEIFLANMSHEIRTPMNGMIGMIDLLAETKLDTEQVNYVQTIKKSSETLLSILNDILDLSKLEAGKMQLKLVPIDLKSTIEKLYALFTQQASSKGIDFKFTIDKEVPVQIKADETRLLQILSNLTSNSIKFTDKGSVQIHIGLEEKSGSKNRFKVKIKDTGIGISAENKSKLFNNFSQIDNSSTKQYAGTGLGLAISKELCRMMQGTIGVESELGKGSEFWFTFEAEDSGINIQENNADGQNQVSIKDRFKAIQPKILLVDDNQVNRMVGTEILKKAGCIVETAENGLIAIDKVKNNQYDLIFMDIQMPKMDGVTATLEIKKLKISKLPPIIAMTAYAMEDDRAKFLQAGMDDYISKPIKSEVLIKKIEEKLLTETNTSYISVNNQTDNLPTIIDGQVILSMKSFLDEEGLFSIYEEFENESGEIMEQCRQNLSVGDLKSLQKELHTLKGSAGTLGIVKVESLAKSIEGKLKKNLYDNLNEQMEEMLAAFTEFTTNYKSILEKYK